MSNDLNHCTFIGRLGKDPETRYMANGDAVTNFSLAVGESWKDKSSGEKKEKTEWVRCVTFGKLAEIAGQYLSKGKQCFVSGKLTTRKWQDKEGRDQYSTEINVDRLQLLGGVDRDEPQQRQAPQRQAPRSSPSKTAQPATGFDDMDDDIPF